MTRAITRALAQLSDPRILSLLGGCVLLSLACFALVWLGLDWLLLAWFGEDVPSPCLWNVVGGLTTAVLAWLLFPLVTSAFVGLFLENVARAVEAKHYPELPRAPGLPFVAGVLASLRFLAVLLLANVLLLFLLLVPVLYPVAYCLVNGYLLGREYFELIALRRSSPSEAQRLRHEHSAELLGTGVALAFLLTLPVVNLLIPVVATATMLHRYEDWRRHGAGGG